MNDNPPRLRKGIIFFAIMLSAILYLSGVFSGLIANKVVKEETKNNINLFKQDTLKDLNELQKYIDFLDTNLKSMQLEEIFAETLTQEERCNFSQISSNELVSQLKYYWDKLPFRIEEYELENNPNEEYLLLKEQYTHLSIRIWILAKAQFDKCQSGIVHGLHFYSADCKDCVAQGEQIDKLHSKVVEMGKEIIMFPIDFNSKDITINNIKKFYSINSTPALILNNEVYQGRLYTSDELLKLIS